MSISVFIDGAVGTTGLEIGDRLSGRADISLITLDDQQRKTLVARRDAINAADFVILCLPDDAAREAVALIDNDHTRVIDASTAHRVAPGWVYGFPEISGRSVVADALRVSNPGCYSTGFIALVAPLVAAGLIPVDWPLAVNAVSGYSGGGKTMIAEFEGYETKTAWRTYALSLAHKHVPEMQRHCGLTHAPLFAPSVARTYRGMIVDVPLPIAVLPARPTVSMIRETLAQHYEGSPFVSVITDFDAPNLTIEQAAQCDRMDLFVFANADESQIRLVAALDNLGKGAAGAAVQSLNLMAGFDETTGLKL
ncbi:MAG: N-acetyl-gamma-glutamyl-phosphate reductase [Sphingomonadaceae bacterium]